MVSSEKRPRRLFFRWTAPRGFAALVLFLVLAILVEFLLVYSFLSLGLKDENMFIWKPHVSLTITISPIFHLLPIGVIAVLVSSWTYLTKNVALVPHRRELPERQPIRRRKRYPGAFGRRLRSIKRFFGGISKKFQGVSRAFKSFYRRISAAVLRIPGVSYLQKKLPLAQAAIKSTAVVLLIFMLVTFALYVLGQQSLVQESVVKFYEGNPFFQGLVLNMIYGAQAVGRALAPIGWLASAINKALLAAAPSLRNALLGLGASIGEPIAKLDLVGKYVLCQNVAAWISALIALAYGRYASRPYRRHRTR